MNVVKCTIHNVSHRTRGPHDITKTWVEMMFLCPMGGVLILSIIHKFYPIEALWCEEQYRKDPLLAAFWLTVTLIIPAHLVVRIYPQPKWACAKQRWVLGWRLRGSIGRETVHYKMILKEAIICMKMRCREWNSPKAFAHMPREAIQPHLF